MNIDFLKKHSLELNNNYQRNPKLSIKITEEFNKQNFHLDLYHLLEKYKNAIDNIKNNKVWDFSKKLTNNFELIHIHSKNKSHNLGIANYDPISRSYFKLWEMIKDFNLIDFNAKSINILGLAEGPGGFIECIYNMRKKYSIDHSDSCLCMSLATYKNQIPGWSKSGRLFKENPSIKIFYGLDNNGDIYKKFNINKLKKIFKNQNNKNDFVTADGGFDFSINYNKQEQLAYRLLFCQIIAAFVSLRTNGNFVLKIFDIFTVFTVKIIYFLTIYFDKVIITKPFTSRPANSEKYIICKNFKGISDKFLDDMISIVEDWEIIHDQKKYVKDIFDFKIPTGFADSIKEYNNFIVSKQIKSILKTLSLIDLSIDNVNINKIKQNQALISSLWCKKYDIPINIRCKYLRENNEQYNYIPNFMNY